MSKEELETIFKFKKIPMTLKLFLNHYSLAILTTGILLFILIIEVSRKDFGENLVPRFFFLTLFSLPFLMSSLAIFFYYGPRQLKLRPIDLLFENEKAAFDCALETIKELKWDAISNNGCNYLRAIRYFNFTTPSSAKATQIIIIIDDKQIFLTSLYYPTSQASWLYNGNDKNLKKFTELVKKKQAIKVNMDII